MPDLLVHAVHGGHQDPALVARSVVHYLVQDNLGRITSDPVLVPSHQVVDRVLAVLLHEVTLDLFGVFGFLVLHNTSSFLSFLLQAVPVAQCLRVCLQVVLLGPRLLALALDFHSDFDNVLPKRNILQLLRLLDHCSQVLEVLLVLLEVLHHRPLRRHFVLIGAATLVLIARRGRQQFELVWFAGVDEEWTGFYRRPDRRNESYIQLVVAEDLGVGLGAALAEDA